MSPCQFVSIMQEDRPNIRYNEKIETFLENAEPEARSPPLRQNL